MADYAQTPAFLESILNVGNSYISVKDQAGRFVYINQLDASLYGLTPADLLGKTTEAMVGPAQFVQWQNEDHAIMAANQPQHFPPYSRVDSAGNIHWFDTVKTPFFDTANSRQLLLVIHRDITVIKNQQIASELAGENLAKLQKKELISLLSGNVAHDFNNILAIIMAATKTISEDPDLTTNIQQSNDAIIVTCQRAADIVSSLRVLGGNETAELPAIELNQCLLDCRESWQLALGGQIQLTFELADQPTIIQGSTSLIEQALWQLLLNSRDAIRDRGEVVIRTERLVGENQQPVIRLSVCDNGAGMDDQTRQKMFDPLFSTRPIGQGNGLGLILVESVVTKHRGLIHVTTAPELGTSIIMDFPAVEAAAPSALPQPAAATSLNLAGATILLVEDEPILRKLLAKYLQAHGGLVNTAENGDQAWDWLAQNSFKIDCLVTDIVMPGTLDGVSLRRKVAAHNPTIPAVIISGHSFDFLSAIDPLPDKTKFMGKPFATGALVEMVQTLLAD